MWNDEERRLQVTYLVVERRGEERVNEAKADENERERDLQHQEDGI